jgi:hypothetical protein
LPLCPRGALIDGASLLTHELPERNTHSATQQSTTYSTLTRPLCASTHKQRSCARNPSGNHYGTFLARLLATALRLPSRTHVSATTSRQVLVVLATKQRPTSCDARFARVVLQCSWSTCRICPTGCTTRPRCANTTRHTLCAPTQRTAALPTASTSFAQRRRTGKRCGNPNCSVARWLRRFQVCNKSTSRAQAVRTTPSAYENDH